MRPAQESERPGAALDGLRTAASPRPADRRRLRLAESLVASALGAITLGSYLGTLLPGIDSWGDVSKWQYLGKVLGIPHPTGYPLYLLLTHLVSEIPLFELAWRINALSAVCAAVTNVAVYLLLRELAVPVAHSSLATLLFAFTRIFWSQAVVAEVYALNAAFVGWTLLFLVRWRRTRQDRDLLSACLIYALSFAHHLTVVCLLPGVVAFVLLLDRAPLRRPRLILPILGFIALGASLYVYPLWRTNAGGPHLEYRIETAGELAAYVTGAQYARAMFSSPPLEVLTTRLPAAGRLIWRELPVLSLFVPLGLWGLRDRKLALLFGLPLVAYLGFNLNYAIHDVEVYYIPVVLLLLVLGATGVHYCAARFASPIVSTAILVGLGCLTLAVFAGNLSRCDASGRTAFHRLVRGHLESMPDGALLVMDGWKRDYAYFEGTLYFLLGEDYGRGKFFVTTPTDPAGLSRYIRGEGRLYSEVMATEVPSGLPVYILSRSIVPERQPFGMRVLREDHDRYRVLVDYGEATSR